MTPRGRLPDSWGHTPQDKLARGCIWIMALAIGTVVLLGVVGMIEAYWPLSSILPQP